MVVTLVCGAIVLGVSIACIPFGKYDLSLLDRFKGVRTPAEHDNKGLE